jgi:hypothetical protein
MLEIVWMKNNDVLDIAGSGGKLSGGSIDNASLVINDVNEFDAGSYQCKATNTVGSTLGNAIVLGTCKFITHYTTGTPKLKLK